MKMMRRRLNNKGFTLLELLIALVVLAFGMMGVAGMILASVRGNAFGTMMMQVNALVQDKIEEMRNTPYLNLYATCGTAGFPVICASAPAAMPLDAGGLVMETANDSGTDGDELTGGAGDGTWTYKYNNAASPLPAGVTLVWGVKRNYPQPRMIWLTALAQWQEKSKTHTVRVESVTGNF